MSFALLLYTHQLYQPIQCYWQWKKEGILLELSIITIHKDVKRSIRLRSIHDAKARQQKDFYAATWRPVSSKDMASRLCELHSKLGEKNEAREY